MQKGRPIAYVSKVLPMRKKGLSTYEKELWAIVLAVEKLGPTYMVIISYQDRPSKPRVLTGTKAFKYATTKVVDQIDGF